MTAAMIRRSVSVDNMRAAWGDDAADWLLVLAEACDASSQARVAKRIGVSSTMVSQCLNRVYTGDYEGLKTAVRANLMAERVACPVMGDLAMSACLEHQGLVRRGVRSSELRLRLMRACPRCPNNRHRDREEG